MTLPQKCSLGSVKNLIGSVFIRIYHKTTPNALWQYVFFLKLTDLHCDLSPVEYG